MSTTALDRVRRGPGRPCTICEHPDRAAIDDDLRCGRRFRRIATQYDLGSEASVRRHAHSHLPPIPAPPNAPPITNPEWLATQLHALNERLHRWMDAFEDAARPNEALRAASEVRKVLELVGRISGQIEDRIVVIQDSHVDLLDRLMSCTVDLVLSDLDAGMTTSEVRARLHAHERTAIETIAQEAP